MPMSKVNVRVYYGLLFYHFPLPECTTREGTPCQIPYVYKGRMHFECTTEAPGSEDLFGRCLEIKPSVLKLIIHVKMPHTSD